MKHHESGPENPSPVEEQIRRPQAEDAFDHLPGHGKAPREAEPEEA